MTNKFKLPFGFDLYSETALKMLGNLTLSIVEEDNDIYIVGDSDFVTIFTEYENEIKKEYVKKAQGTLTAIIEGFPVEFFADGDYNKLYEYKRKQAAVAAWNFGDPAPALAKAEWEGDWLNRQEWAENGVVLVEALGRKFECRNASDLAATWKLNALLAEELTLRSLPVRKNTSRAIETASSEAEINTLLAGVEPQLYGIVMSFDAAGAVEESGLVSVEQPSGYF